MSTKKWCIFLITFIFTLYLAILPSCGRNVRRNASCMVEDTVSYREIGQLRDGIISVEKNVDLHGNVCSLPLGATLHFKGGIIYNGTIVGNRTKIIANASVFDHVSISGTWNVPQISTTLFRDLSYENSLKDVMALANSDIGNKINVENGTYTVSASEEKESCLTIPSNTEVRLDGIIRLKPNALKSSNIILVKGKNIRLTGNGSIIGDKYKHTGTEGEWGMGINVSGSNHVAITGISVKDCWGDCIYVGGVSKNVEIANCRLDHGRRQGVSVTSADSVVIRNTSISNVRGKKPEYGIDLEPNKNGVVDHVTIDHVTISDCAGGILATKGSKNKETKRIGKIKITGSTVTATSYYPVRITNCEQVEIVGCKTTANSADLSAIITVNVCEVNIHNNIIYIKTSLFASLKDTAKKMMGREGYKAIRVKQAVKKRVQDNEEIKVN